MYTPFQTMVLLGSCETFQFHGPRWVYTVWGLKPIELKFYHLFSITVGYEVDSHIIRYEQWRPVPGKGFCKCLNSATNNVSAIVKKGKNKQDIIWISLFNSFYF